jgi:hypothetical protein
MSRLRTRITRQARAGAAAQASYHPYGTPETPMEMPMVRVFFGPGGASVQQMVPLITANGAPVPATAPGQYGQVTISGGGRY